MINTDDRIFDEGLTANEGWLLQFIASKINEDGEMWWSNEKIRKKLGWSMVRLQSTKEKLVEKGYLQITPRFNNNNPSQTSNLYKILTPLTKNYTPTSKLGRGGISELDRGDTSKLGTAHVSNLGTAPTSKLDNEVLITEELDNEELTIEELRKEDKYISHAVHSIFKTLVCCIFEDWSDYSHALVGYDYPLEEITDPTIRKTLEKLGVVARKIYDAFDALKRPLPEWREGHGMFGSSKGEINALTEAQDQIRAYADYCRMTKQYMITDPEKAPEKLVAVDWCKKLLDHVKPLIDAEKYDPAYDEENLHSGWLMDMYYYQPIGVNVCTRYNNRIVWGGEEYLKVKK